MPLAEDQPLFLHPWHRTGQEPTVSRKPGQPRRESSSQAGARLLPTAKAKPFLSKQVQPQSSCRCADLHRWASHWAGQGLPAQHLPPTAAIAAGLPGARELPWPLGLGASDPLQDF